MMSSITSASDTSTASDAYEGGIAGLGAGAVQVIRALAQNLRHGYLVPPGQCGH